MVDTVIIGAGLAGITCARSLQAAGREVMLLDKSRGIGGRLATRRLHGTHADHGFRVWAPQNPDLQALTAELLGAGILHPWGEGYASKDGGNAIAKYLARDLTIHRQHRVVRLAAVKDIWHIEAEVSDTSDVRVIDARQMILALPAPQAADLLSASGFSSDAIASIREVEYAPCVTVMAGYDPPIAGWPDQAQVVSTDGSSVQSMIQHIILDSSKRSQGAPAVVVIHSTGDFAQRTLAIDRNWLEPVAQDLLQAAAALVPGLAQPKWFQVHRWRYALVTRPCPEPYITLSVPTANPVMCCGDWCRPYQSLDAAYQSGQAVAQRVCNLL